MFDRPNHSIRRRGHRFLLCRCREIGWSCDAAPFVDRLRTDVSGRRSLISPLLDVYSHPETLHINSASHSGMRLDFLLRWYQEIASPCKGQRTVRSQHLVVPKRRVHKDFTAQFSGDGLVIARTAAKVNAKVSNTVYKRPLFGEWETTCSAIIQRSSQTMRARAASGQIRPNGTQREEIGFRRHQSRPFEAITSRGN